MIPRSIYSQIRDFNHDNVHLKRFTRSIKCAWKMDIADFSDYFTSKQKSQKQHIHRINFIMYRIICWNYLSTVIIRIMNVVKIYIHDIYFECNSFKQIISWIFMWVLILSGLWYNAPFRAMLKIRCAVFFPISPLLIGPRVIYHNVSIQCVVRECTGVAICVNRTYDLVEN